MLILLLLFDVHFIHRVLCFQAFTVTTIFSVIMFSLAVLPFGIRGIAEARIALKRVQVFKFNPIKTVKLNKLSYNYCFGMFF